MKTLVLLGMLAACSAQPMSPVAKAGRREQTASAPSPPSPPPKLDAIIAKAIGDAHLLGLAVAIVDHGHAVVEQGYGFTDLDRTKSITAETVFEIGSLSKQFTAAAVLRLVDDRKLMLSDRAATYLPEIPGDITIEQLLWQTAGLAEYAYGINVGKSPDELVSTIGSMPPDFPAGTQWHYSNSNYYVLGRLVEVVGQQSYADYMHDQVLARAGLTSTRVCAGDTAEAKPSIVVDGALEKGGAFHDVMFYGGAGAICSNALDLLRWQDALFGGKVLSPSSLAVMTTPGKLADGTVTDYAAGLIIDHVANHRRIWHNGAVPTRYESELAWYPDDRLQIVLLTNTLNTPPGATLGALERALAVEQLHIKTADEALRADELAHYTGRFKTGAISALVTIDASHLHVHVDGGVNARLLYQGAARFVLDGHPGVEYRFVMSSDGSRAIGIEVWRDDKKFASLDRVED